MSSVFPCVFVGHGSPMNTIHHTTWLRSLESIQKELPPKPQAVLVISAHWVTQKTEVLISPHPRTIHDFYGFPEELFKIQYPAPGFPESLKKLHSLGIEVQGSEAWGLDHGAWSVLRHLYPEARIPVFQLSLQHHMSLQQRWELGQKLSPLREQGILLLGSGDVVHNLQAMSPNPAETPPLWAQNFDQHLATALKNKDQDTLVSLDQKWPQEFKASHPTAEHLWPLLIIAGAARNSDTVSFPFADFQHGTISLRHVLYQS